MTASPRWKQRPPGSNWGEFGPDDQLGRLNLLTPDKVRAAVAEVREGRRFCLSLPLDYPGGNVLNERRHPPRLSPTLRGGKPVMNFPLSRVDPRHTDVISDDAALIHLQYSTQWDSFAHVGQMFDADGDGVAEMVYYNGFRAGEDVLGPVDYRGGGETPWQGVTGARSLGIENMASAAIQGRGVLVDLLAHVGRERSLIGYDMLRRVLDADRVEVEEGDLVCLRTGFADLILEMGGAPDIKRLDAACAVLDGRDERLLQWIADSGLSALIADNYAVEAYPARACEDEPCAALPLHAHCLFRLGIPLGELWSLRELADWLRVNGRSRFLLTAPPLRLPGAVGSPVTPVATV
jgi:kynurenine formamidase